MKMARPTYRNYIEKMFFFIGPMMIFCGWVRTRITEAITGYGKIAAFDSPVHGHSSFSAFRIFLTMLFSKFLCNYFAFFGLEIKFFLGVVFLCVISAKSLYATFTPRIVAIQAVSGAGELADWFCFLAVGTLFEYDWLSHDRFSNKRLCLEPFSGYTPDFGLFYCIASQRKLQ